MSAKSRAIGDTENEFQAALATYTKAGNKTAAMRRLWNAAYMMGGEVAVAAIQDAKESGFEEGRRSEFEKRRQAGVKEALTADALAVSFASGQIAGIATGMEHGRDAETQRWKDGGHFEDGTCRAFGGAAIVDSSPPPKPIPDDVVDTLPVPGAFLAHTRFNWADDAESLPIHPVLVPPSQPRDFSGLRSDSTNPFDTLQRRHARHIGTRTTSRRHRTRPFHSVKTYTDTRSTPTSLKPAVELQSGYDLPSFGILAWIWMLFYGPPHWRLYSG